jgi:predicted transcriptional regulator
MKYSVKHENLTYEEISSLYETTPNKVHMMIKRVYNKIITSLVKDKNVNIWDAIMGTKDFFGRKIC